MTAKYLALASCVSMALGTSFAVAGPCNNGKDAGSGPTPGSTGTSVTPGSADTHEHPPPQTMNRATDNIATSAQDAQRQQQGQPTAAQQAEGAKPSTKPSQQTADQGC